jgi:hypothetical protein
MKLASSMWWSAYVPWLLNTMTPTQRIEVWPIIELGSCVAQILKGIFVFSYILDHQIPHFNDYANDRFQGEIISVTVRRSRELRPHRQLASIGARLSDMWSRISYFTWMVRGHLSQLRYFFWISISDEISDRMCQLHSQKPFLNSSQRLKSLCHYRRWLSPYRPSKTICQMEILLTKES